MNLNVKVNKLFCVQTLIIIFYSNLSYSRTMLNQSVNLWNGQKSNLCNWTHFNYTCKVISGAVSLAVHLSTVIRGELKSAPMCVRGRDWCNVELCFVWGSRCVITSITMTPPPVIASHSRCWITIIKWFRSAHIRFNLFSRFITSFQYTIW